jgi:hypothetical protein
MAHGSWLAPTSLFVQGDHSYDERDVGNIPVFVADDRRVESHVVEVDRLREGEWEVVTDPVRYVDPTGNLEGEVFVEHHWQFVDAVDIDAQVERSSVFVSCHLDDESQGQDVMEGKRWHSDRTLKTGPNIERPGSRIHLGMIGDEGALDPHQNEPRTAVRERFRRIGHWHCLFVYARRLGTSPDVNSLVIPTGTSARMSQ